MLSLLYLFDISTPGSYLLLLKVKAKFKNMKVLSLLLGFFILTGCAETMALLGPASSIVGGGNIAQSSVSSVVNYGIKKSTGKSPVQHALAYAKEKNPNKKKDRCISFVKKTDSEACYIAKKQISSVKKKTVKKINKVFNSSSKIVKKIETKHEPSTQLNFTKDKSNLNIDLKKEPKLKSVESMFVQTAVSKKHITHLKVSIDKSYKIKDLNN